MATKKPEQKSEKVEREYVIPLRKKYNHVPRYKKTPKAVKSVKEFLVRHMKIRDRDLKKIKIDSYLNEFLWFRGIKKPPFKVKVRVVKEKDIVRVYLADMPTKLKFKQLRVEKAEKKALEAMQKKKTLMEKAKEGMTAKPGEEKKEGEITEEKKDAAEEKEKKAAVVEAGKQIEKAAAKSTKHSTASKMKQPKRQQRKALAK